MIEGENRPDQKNPPEQVGLPANREAAERAHYVDRRQFLKGIVEIAVGSVLVGVGTSDRVAGVLKDQKIWQEATRAVQTEGSTPPSKLDEIVNERAKQTKAEAGHSKLRDLGGDIVLLTGAALNVMGIRDWGKAKYLAQIRQNLHNYMASPYYRHGAPPPADFWQNRQPQNRQPEGTQDNVQNQTEEFPGPNEQK